MDVVFMIYEADVCPERVAGLLQKAYALFMERIPNGRIFCAVSAQYCQTVIHTLAANNGNTAHIFEIAGTTFIEQLYSFASLPVFQTAIGEHICAHDIFRAQMPQELLNTGCSIFMKQPECAVFPSVPLKDTIKRVDTEMTVTETPDRATLKRAQTPLFLAKQTLLRMIQERSDTPPNSFISACLQAGITMRTYEGSYMNGITVSG